VDFDILLGDSVCVPLEPLADNQVSCIPPAVKPKKNINDTFCHRDAVSLYVSEYRLQWRITIFGPEAEINCGPNCYNMKKKYTQSKLYIEPIYAVLQRQEHRAQNEE